MKTLFVVASLAFALVATPAIAQLGPAGVPGAPGLAETDPSVKPAPPAPAIVPPAAKAQPRKRVAADCSEAKNVARCNALQDARKNALAACKGETGAERKQCLKEQKQGQKADCSKSPDPARCEQHKKTRELCKDKAGREHRQCLRDNLAPTT